MGGAVHLDYVLVGGRLTEGGETLQHAVAHARVLLPVGRSERRGHLVQGQLGAVGRAHGLLAPGVGEHAGVVGDEAGVV